MKKVTLTIRTVTPTLMGGGFGQNDGIRPSEIKGLMRYWFRAVAGSFIIHFPEDKFKHDLENLKKSESDIFGSIQNKSSFRIIVNDTRENLETEDLSHLPHKKWSKNNPLKVIASNNDFSLKILIRKVSFKKTTIHEYENFLKNILKISFFFGVGFRKNRFFGNMILENEEIKDIESVVKDIKDFISENFSSYGSDYRVEKKKTLLPLFPTFSYRNNTEKNYYISEVLSNCNIYDWENFLENFYKKIIHKIEKNNELKFFIDGGIRNFHKYSLLNFSYINEKIYLSSFFHKNNGYLRSPKSYKDWKNGLNKIEEIIKDSRL